MEKVLGITKDNEILQIKVENDGYASVCFSFSEIKRADETIRNKEYMLSSYEELVDCFSKSFLYAQCDEYDCPPSKLPEKMYEEDKKDDKRLLEHLDCSYIPKILNVDDTEYVFLAMDGGQADPREKEILDIVDVKLYTDILNYWDNYHLKKIDDNKEALELYNSIVERMKDLDDEEIISSYIRKFEI